MKYFLLTTIILIRLTAAAQSPYLSIMVKMDSIKAETTRYKIEMKICEPKMKTERGDWFTHDTSKIDFALLKTNEIICGEYFDNGIGEPLTYNKEEIPFNKFEFSNQVFTWEKIFVFKISNWSSRGWHPEMYIVLPIKYKSFITYITLNDIEFQSGKIIFLTNANAFYDENKLNITESLKNEKGAQVKVSSFKEIVENNN